jgi:phosphatidate cytidylyltransferase
MFSGRILTRKNLLKPYNNLKAVTEDSAEGSIEVFFFRLLSSIILISLFLLSITWKSDFAHFIFVIFASFLAFFAIRETLAMLAKTGIKSYSLFSSLFATFFIISVMFDSSKFISPLTVFSIFAVISWLILLFKSDPDNGTEVLSKIFNSAGALLLVMVPLLFLAKIYMAGHGENAREGINLLLFMVLVTKSGDIGAYFFGTVSNKIMNGNHKIVPSVSPKKSWEGTIGGLFITILVAICFKGYGDFSFIEAVILGTLLFIGGFVGDLAESTLKRRCGVKDSGNSIPGIGGVLDLLDSLLLNAPLFYLFVTLI